MGLPWILGRNGIPLAHEILVIMNIATSEMSL